MLGLDAQTTGHATQGHGGLFRGASDFQEAGLTGIGQEATGHEGAAPCRFDLGDGSVDHFRRQSTDLLLAAVDQSGLQSQGHYVAGDEHHIGLDRAVRGLTCEVIDLGFVPERVPQRVLQPFCNVKRGEYGLDNVCILYRSKTAAKTDHGRSLGLDRGWRIAFKGCQLAFDIVQKSQDLPPTVPFFSMLQALRAVICCHTVGSHRLSVIPNLVDKRTRLIRIMGPAFSQCGHRTLAR